MEKSNRIVYEPNKYLKSGFLSLAHQMVTDLRTSGELGYRLFLRDFSAKYRQSLLGLLWVVLIPLFTVGIFAVMNRSGVLAIRNTGVPYPVYALFGITVWTLFTGLTSSIAGVVGATGGLITKINFPRIALLHSPVLISFVDFGVRLVLLTIFMLLSKVFPHPQSVLFLFALLPLVCMAIGIGMFLAIVGAIFKDIANFVNMALTIAMFLTPVVYPLPQTGLLIQVNFYNPLYYFIEVPRTLLFSGRFDFSVGYALSAAASVVVLLTGWRFYQLAMARIVEKA